MLFGIWSIIATFFTVFGFSFLVYLSFNEDV